jgi:putative flippase GtrA
MDKFFKNIFYFWENQGMDEKIRYFFIGVLCALADLLILYVLVDVFHYWYLTASVISFTIVSFTGYWGQKYYTFKNVSKKHGQQITIFFIIAVLGLGLNSLLMFFLVGFLGLWYILGSIITKLIVFIWNFTANKYITFRDTENESINKKLA